MNRLRRNTIEHSNPDCDWCSPGATQLNNTICNTCLTRIHLQAAADKLATSSGAKSDTQLLAAGTIKTVFAAKPRLLEAPREWLRDEFRRLDLHADSVYFHGRTGRGKSTQAALLLRYTIMRDADRSSVAKPADYAWWNTVTLLEQLKYAPFGEVRPLIRQMSMARVLVLDDLGSEEATERSRARLYEIVNNRYEQCLPIVVTSNLGPQRLLERLGDRTASRIIEMCGENIIDLTVENHRLGGAA